MSQLAVSSSLGARIAAACLLAVGMVGFGAGYYASSQKIAAPDPVEIISVDSPQVQQISFQTDTGQISRWADYANQPRLIFFGYTFCPDICPMGLSNVAGALDLMGDDPGVTPIFVSVDPTRDTPQVLHEYVGLFHKSLQAVTTDDAQMRVFAAAFSAHYEIHNQDPADPYYLIDHTSFIYLVGTDGHILGYYPESTAPSELASAIGRDLSHQ